ncbi:MAG: peptide-methionine (S)-S-oxide reductase MsrA [Candidatus Sungbacteria bacterium]|nr:peptide-methionine (S)-S-oxide reductase MsrA [Candidatus Sungbacteria bacterium]
MSKETVVFGGGCFWCTEAVFLELKGVLSVTSGYAGGTLENPTYDRVSAGGTGHAEVIQIDYDPLAIPFRKLLEVFFTSHDPTTKNRQGADVGDQYRSIILYTAERQKQEAEAYIRELTEAKKFPDPIVTELKPLDRFWHAEDYHLNFYAKNPDNPYAEAVIAPKLEKVRRLYKNALKGRGE